jgi:putative FmdB family regulatory protein
VLVTTKEEDAVPIYEYQCDSCSYRFEVKQSIKDAPLTTCERCGKPLRRLISSPGIMFKGSGWYVTDYSNKLKPPSEGDKAPATAGEKKDVPAGSSTTAPAPASQPAASTSGSTSSPTPAPTPSKSDPSNK